MVTGFARCGAMLFALAMQSLLAWMLGPDGRGEYALCLVFSNLSGAILAAGMDWSCSYYISSKKIPFNQTISMVIMNCIFLSIAAGMILPFFKLLPLEFFSKIGDLSFGFSIVWAISLVVYSYVVLVLTGLKSFALLAILTTLKATLTFLFTFILFETTPLNVSAPILADIISCGIVTFYVIIHIIRKYQFRFEMPKSHFIRQYVSYGLRFFGGSLGMIANARIGTILLSFYVIQSDLGLFAQAMAILAQFITLSDIACRILQPRVADSDDGRLDLVVRAARVVGLVVMLFGCCFLILSPYVVPLLFSPKFVPMIPVMLILMPGIWIRTIGKTLFPYFNGTNRPGIVSKATFINLLVNIILLFVLVKPFGLLGAAWATTLAYFSSSMFIFYVIERDTDVCYVDLFVPRFSDWYELKNHLHVWKKPQTEMQVSINK
ncbi:polysaccharide biosynthesis C-terminal domain-containing protein [Poriferisphaera sp. WC338]|uniref:oligosaccharide flippase family protein n=1 Tax=Poriferisphaera sp. WC338 TaxID=3425129 RepID=UPI003D81C026